LLPFFRYHCCRISCTIVAENSVFILAENSALLSADYIRVKDYFDRDDELQKTGAYFLTGVAADSITNPNAREYGTTIFLFTGAKIDIRQRIEDEIAEERKY